MLRVSRRNQLALNRLLCGPSTFSQIPSSACLHTSAPTRTNWLSLLSLAVLSGGLGFTYATLYPSKLALLINHPDVPAPLAEESPEGQALCDMIEQQMQNLDIVKRFRAERDVVQSANQTSLESSTPAQLEQAPKWIETRPYQRFPREQLHHHLTAGTLRGPGKMAVKPLVFSTRDNKESYIILHLGPALCGHKGIVHGGLLATIMDETLARPTLLNLPAQVGVTAYLHMEYKSPCEANQFVVVHTYLTELEGRKAFSEGDMKTLDGKLLVKANGLFVQPKMAHLFSNTAVKAALGVPEEGNKERV